MLERVYWLAGSWVHNVDMIRAYGVGSGDWLEPLFIDGPCAPECAMRKRSKSIRRRKGMRTGEISSKVNRERASFHIPSHI